MTVAQVLSGLAARPAPGRVGPRPDGLTAAAFGGARMGTLDYAVAYLFDGAGALGAIELRLLRSGGRQMPAGIDPFVEASSWLTRRHGEPTAQDRTTTRLGHLVRVARWQGPGGPLELRAIGADPGDPRVLGLDFGSGRIQAVVDSDVVLSWRRP